MEPEDKRPKMLAEWLADGLSRDELAQQMVENRMASNVVDARFMIALELSGLPHLA